MNAIHRARRRLFGAWPGNRPAPAPEKPARTVETTLIEVTTITRSRGGKVVCQVITLPAHLPLKHLQVEACAALQAQYGIIPETLDSVRIHFDHFAHPVSAIEEAAARGMLNCLARGL